MQDLGSREIVIIFMANEDEWQVRCFTFPRAIVLHLCELGSPIKYQVQRNDTLSDKCVFWLLEQPKEKVDNPY